MALDRLTDDMPGRIGVIDIGSNTVRLVVYDTPNRLPIPMFNEKAQCALGRGLAASGVLSPEGAEFAEHTLARFVHLARAMGVDHVEAVATAAVRDASDGQDFVKRVRKRLGLEIQVLSGAEEARLAALGLIMGVPDADGMLCDLGGGSFDLVALDKGRFAETATLKLGHLRLYEDSDGDVLKAPKVVQKRLKEVDWLDAIKGRTLYATGGSLRAVARIMIDQTKYPIHVIDHYTMEAGAALGWLDVIGHMSKESLKNVKDVPKKRLDTLPFAAIALKEMIEKTGAAKVSFSGYGMREGQMLKSLNSDLRDHDPLIDAAKTMNERMGRFRIKGHEILDWMQPIFPDETPEERRLRYAACLLSDVGWNEHPDYRGEHAFLRILRIPFAGLEHWQRALLALTIYERYNGDIKDSLAASARGLLDEGQLKWVKTKGLALRLAHTLSGSAPGLLPKAKLSVEGGKLILTIPHSPSSDRDMFAGEAVERRLKSLAASLGLKSEIA